MFILTLAFTVTTLSFSLADCGLTAYADYGLNPGISGDTLDLDILNRKFIESASKSKYDDPAQRTYDKRFNETMKSTGEGLLTGKLIPAISEYIGKSSDWVVQKMVKSINDRGKWGLSELERLGLTKNGKLIPEPTKFRTNSAGQVHETMKHMKWRKAGRLKESFEKFSKFSFDPKLMDKLGKFTSFAGGLYGFYQMYENPNIGFNSPFFEFCGMTIKGIGNTVSVFAAFFPQYKKQLDKVGELKRQCDFIHFILTSKPECVIIIKMLPRRPKKEEPIMARDFFDKLTASVSKTVKQVSDNTKSLADKNRVRKDISSIENEMRNRYREIGEKYFTEHRDAPDPDYAEIFNAIFELETNLADKHHELELLEGTVPCPSCGIPVAIGSRFCPGCGAAAPAPAPAQPAAQTVCPVCKTPLAPNAQFCAGCGSKVEAPAPAAPAQVFCANCGEPLAPGMMFCASCGTKAPGFD